MNDTWVTYPGGATQGTATIVAILDYDNHKAIIVDKTPFHPVDHKWPDQPSDRGTIITSDGISCAVKKCVTAAQQNGTPDIHFHTDIPVPRGIDGWSYYCAHLVEVGSNFSVGEEINLSVDDSYRASLNTGHTGCHLAALALNKVLAELWKKNERPDSLGNPNFDQTAIQVSKISEGSSYDSYRVGKTVKKRGFKNQEFWDNFEQLEFRINKQLSDWVDQKSEIKMTPSESSLTDMRTWSCNLDGIKVEMPCGGTHLSSFAEIGEIRVSLVEDKENGSFEMTTKTVKI